MAATHEQLVNHPYDVTDPNPDPDGSVAIMRSAWDHWRPPTPKARHDDRFELPATEPAAAGD